MSPKLPNDESYTPVFERVEKNVARFLDRNPNAMKLLTILVSVIILSPLVILLLGDTNGAKDWSETIKNVIESGAVLAAVFAVIKWVQERQDRATEVLLKLEEKFSVEAVVKGRDLIDDDARYQRAAADIDKVVRERRVYSEFDAVLRFYVILYGVRIAKQVPDNALSVCFRYWLAHYFHKDRKEFQKYIDASYPTLSRWLREDCKDDCRFFRPTRLFGDNTDTAFIKKCSEEVNE